jgi:hypothetical protein
MSYNESMYDASISQLKLALEIAENNEPINRSAGNTKQADMEFSNAEDYRKAISVLEWFQKAGILQNNC